MIFKNFFKKRKKLGFCRQLWSQLPRGKDPQNTEFIALDSI